MSDNAGLEQIIQGQITQLLSDPTQLPAELVSVLPQIVAQNPVPTAKTSGTRIAYSTRTSSVSTTGTSFAAGADILSSAIEFTATGSNSYLVTVSGSGWQGSASGISPELRLNLDGADAGRAAIYTATGASNNIPLSGRAIIVTPSAGEHSLNLRLMLNLAGTATINAGAGGAATLMPIVVTLEVA